MSRSAFAETEPKLCRITLPVTVRLPENTKVLIVVTEGKNPARVSVETGDDGLPVIRARDSVITSRFVKTLENVCL